MTRFWPHTCRVPGDGATILPRAHPMPLWSLTGGGAGHDGAWLALRSQPRFRVYGPTPREREAEAWELLVAWVACPCQRATGGL